MRYVEKELEPLKYMRYHSEELENEMNEVIAAKGINSVTLSNATTVYVILLNHFIDRILEFDYSWI